MVDGRRAGADRSYPHAGRAAGAGPVGGAPAGPGAGCRFVTTDLALRADGGGWMVVEVGDGQVSDLPRGTEVSALFASLIAA